MEAGRTGSELECDRVFERGDEFWTPECRTGWQTVWLELSSYAEVTGTRMLDTSRRGFCLIVIMGSGAALAAQPSFDLSWDVPSDVRVAAGDTVVIDAVGFMTPGGDVGDSGAQGWSMSCTADGWAITGITTDGTTAADVSMGGLRNTGFEISELTSRARPGSDCDGRDGAVSAVILSFVMEVTWPPDEPSDIVVVQLEGTASGNAGESVSCSISFTDGCQGSGQPVDNRVTHRWSTIIPGLGSATTLVDTIDDRPCPLAGDISIAVSGSGSQQEGADVRVSEFDEPPLRVDAFGPPGEIAQATVFAEIISNDAGTGVQGWSLSVAVENGEVVDATTEGTIAADVAMGGKRNTGYEVTEIIDPSREPTGGPLAGRGPQGSGVVSALVLSFVTNITLDTTGTATVLAITVSSGEPLVDGNQAARVVWRDGLQGSGQPVNTVLTIDGNTVRPCGCRDATILFGHGDILVVRCDANLDGNLDLADSVRIVNELFREGSVSGCEKASDCNGDGQIDLSDVTYGVAYRFQGGPSPPAPFPECGLDVTEDDLTCEDSGCL